MNSKDKKKTSSIILLLLAAAFVCCTFCLSYFFDNYYTKFDTNSQIEVKGGFRYFSQTDEAFEDTFSISSMLYYDKIVTPDNVDAQASPLVVAPGQSLFPDGKASARKEATYRFNVVYLGAKNVTFSIFFPAIYGSAAIYVNGKLIDSFGETDGVQYVKDCVVTCNIIRSADVVICVSGRNLPYFGLQAPPLVGTPENVRNVQSGRTVTNIVALCLIAFVFILCVVLCFMERNKIFALFSMLTLSVATCVICNFALLTGAVPLAAVLISILAKIAAFALVFALAVSGLPKLKLFKTANIAFAVLFSVPALLCCLVLPFVPAAFGAIRYLTAAVAIAAYLYAATASILARGRKSFAQFWIILPVFAGVIFDAALYAQFSPLYTFGFALQSLMAVSLFVGAYALYYAVDFVKKIRSLNSGLSTEVKNQTAYINEIMDERKQFLTSVAHDFKSPLASIKLSLEKLQDRDVAEEIRDEVNLIDLKTDNLAGKLTALQTFNAMDLPREEHTEFDAIPILKQLAADTATDALAAGILFTCRFPSYPVFVVSQRDKLTRAIENILFNAIERTPENKNIRFEASVKNEILQITVFNEGDGVAPDVLPRVFELNFSTRACASGFNGLGLFFTKLVVEESKGRVSASSEYGKYAAFTVELPISK